MFIISKWVNKGRTFVYNFVKRIGTSSKKIKSLFNLNMHDNMNKFVTHSLKELSKQ